MENITPLNCSTSAGRAARHRAERDLAMFRCARSSLRPLLLSLQGLDVKWTQSNIVCFAACFFCFVLFFPFFFPSRFVLPFVSVGGGQNKVTSKFWYLSWKLFEKVHPDFSINPVGKILIIPVAVCFYSDLLSSPHGSVCHRVQLSLYWALHIQLFLLSLSHPVVMPPQYLDLNVELL